MELLAGVAFSASLSPLLLRFCFLKDFSSSGHILIKFSVRQVLRWTRFMTQCPILIRREQLPRESVRDDYREFIELSIIFLGGLPARGIHFMAPGAMHHARWLSKIIYSLKVWMFRSQFKLTSFEQKVLRNMYIFAVVIYLKAWFTAPLAACAPYSDLYYYKQYDEAISKAICKKLEHHLWYISKYLVGLAFFDSDVQSETKQRMVNALKSKKPYTPSPGSKRITLTASQAS